MDHVKKRDDNREDKEVTEVYQGQTKECLKNSSSTKMQKIMKEDCRHFSNSRRKQTRP